MLKSIQRLVIPAVTGCLSGFFDIWHMDIDSLGLTDTIETADSLLEEIWIERQVKQYQVMGKLEVAAFAADL